jgi:hypothetical protein
MNIPSIQRLDRSRRAAYWAVVRDCLVDLFNSPISAANTLTNDRMAEVEFAPKSVKSDIFYHHEPFDVAAELAARNHPSPKSLPNYVAVATAYEKILARHGLA